MYREFRLILRGGFVLLVLAGIALILYAVISDGRDREPAPEAPAGAAAPPAPEKAPQRAPTQKAPGTASAEAAPATESPPANMRSELRGFESVLIDPESNREEAVVRGERADLQDKTWEIEIPRVIVNLWPGEGQPLDFQLEKVRVTAKRAKLDEGRGVVRLFEDVVARGEDFGIRTQSVLYDARNRSLTSDEAVVIQKDKTSTEGAPMPAMLVNGQGLNVDLALRQMTILKDVEARLFDVSEEFLAATPTRDGATRDVLITSAGKMVYAHLAHKVDFHQDVRAVSGGKNLTCDQLSVLLRETEGAGGGLEVSNIVATGNVELVYADPDTGAEQVARGERLEWHNVTQTGSLTGEHASLSTPQFEMSSSVLTFYRLNDRFDAEGPGTLLWKASETGPSETEADREPPQAELGPLRLREDGPVQVTWNRAMAYHVAAQKASFEGDVTV
ncbi:MAG: LPS export ABC transporter periplasmic protein LptC, partial [Planctomycetota bacterium]